MPNHIVAIPRHEQETSFGMSFLDLFHQLRATFFGMIASVKSRSILAGEVVIILSASSASFASITRYPPSRKSLMVSSRRVLSSSTTNIVSDFPRGSTLSCDGIRVVRRLRPLWKINLERCALAGFTAHKDIAPALFYDSMHDRETQVPCPSSLVVKKGSKICD
jgi:hypothetical protein